MAGKETRKLTVLLAGNPNVGKSTLFNVLTGMHQHTGNWPGKTVGAAMGSCVYEGTRLQLVDLPGTYSLEGNTEDERIAGECLRHEAADCIVAVCDGSCLERSLILVLQILSLGRPTLVCVNLMDEAASRGIRIDIGKLSAMLGVPVVGVSARKGQGLDLLKEMLLRMDREQGSAMQWDDPISHAQTIAESCAVHTQVNEAGWRRELDRLLLSRRHGIPVMLGLLFVIIWLTVWGANYPSRLLENFFAWGYRTLHPLFSWMPEWLQEILLDGIYTTCTSVISVMLPPMAIFFPLFTFLEDVGYLPRMAFLLDHGMHRWGGCGKQALTLCMGLGCNAVGVMGCRIIDSPKERLAATLTNAMVPCNGRFPTLIILGSLFFPGSSAALVVAVCVALGMAGAMGVSGLLCKWCFHCQGSAFVMEMPPFRRPRLGQILVRSVLDRTVQICLRTLRVAAPAGALLWIMGNTGMLGKLGEILDPVGRFLGMNGLILTAFLFALPANELLIPILLMGLTGAGSLAAVSGVSETLLQSGLTWQMALCVMVFTLYHWPCATTLMTIRKETGSYKKTAAAFLLPTAVGMLLCVILRIVLGYFGA